MKVKQTSGRDYLGEFAPEFAKLNDDVLFGDVWSGINISTEWCEEVSDKDYENLLGENKKLKR